MVIVFELMAQGDHQNLSLKSTAKASLNPEFACVELGLEGVEDIFGAVRNAGTLMVLKYGLAARVKFGLNAAMFNSTANCSFDEVAEGLVLSENGIELSAQLRFNADLGDDCGFHAGERGAFVLQRQAWAQRQLAGAALVR